MEPNCSSERVERLHDLEDHSEEGRKDQEIEVWRGGSDRREG